MRVVRRAGCAVAVLLLLAAAFFMLRPKMAHLGSLPASVDWRWLLAGVVGIGWSYVGSALALRVAAAHPLPLGRTVLVQLAAAATNRVTPAGLGGAAVNGRYLVGSGVARGRAGAAIAGVAAVHALVTGAAMLLTTAFAWEALPDGVLPSLPSLAVPSWWEVAGVLVLAGGAVWAARLLLRRATRVRGALLDAAHALRDLARSPRRLGLVSLAVAAAKLGQACALLAALHAVGGALPPVLVVLVYLGGTTVGSAVPTPAGLGGVEAALTAGLVAVGGVATAAVAGVLLFRLLSFWLPILPGVGALGVLRSRRTL